MFLLAKFVRHLDHRIRQLRQMKIDKQADRSANEWELPCPLMVPELVIYFAWFQSCQSAFSQLSSFTTTLGSSVSLPRPKRFVFRRLYSTWPMQLPSFLKGEEGWIEVHVKFECARLFSVDELPVWGRFSHVQMCLSSASRGVDQTNLQIYISVRKGKRFNMFPFRQPHCYLHSLALQQHHHAAFLCWIN